MARELPWFEIKFYNGVNIEIKAKNKMDAIKRTCEHSGCKAYDIKYAEMIREPKEEE